MGVRGRVCRVEQWKRLSICLDRISAKGTLRSGDACGTVCPAGPQESRSNVAVGTNSDRNPLLLPDGRDSEVMGISKNGEERTINVLQLLEPWYGKESWCGISWSRHLPDD